MRNGLDSREIEAILKPLREFSSIEQALIFGSRAKGNNKKGSDVDLAIKGKGITEEIVKRLSYVLNEETLLPFFFDVVHYESINNPELVQHIDRVGVMIYKK